MSNIKIIITLFPILFLSNCKSNAQIVKKTYRFQSSESNIYDATVILKKDSTVTLSGGKGQYRHWTSGRLEKKSNNKYIIFQTDKQKGGIKVQVTDKKMRKALMLDNSNDTLYFSENKKTFVYKGRTFKLEEY